MNDFVIQFYHDNESVKYFDFYGLNNENDYRNYLNLDSNKFSFKLINNEQRLRLLRDFTIEDKIKSLKKFYADNFNKLWFGLFGNYPSPYLTFQYLIYIVQGDGGNLLKYTGENILKLTKRFIESKFK